MGACKQTENLKPMMIGEFEKTVPTREQSCVGSPARILVVDDIDANLLVLERMLKAGGYEVIKAKNGEQAIEAFEKESPDLILMDINMPKVDGHEATKHIKTMTGDHYVPIVVVTALTEESSLAKSLAAGGDDFIGKPVSYDVLHSKIKAHLRIRELNREINIKNRELAKYNERLLREQELINHFFEKALAQSDLDDRIIKYHMSAKSVFNGDILLAKYSPDGVYYLVLGDFTGHGLTAAMGTLPVAQIFFEMVQQDPSLPQLARELNRQLKKLLPVEMFFTAILVSLDSKAGRLTVWAGAMPTGWWISEDGEVKGTINSAHLPLGVQRDSDFSDEVEQFDVENGDKFYLYSDGVTEMRNSDGEMFGSERIEQALSSSSSDIFSGALEALQEFRGADKQADDITFVELTCRLTSET